MEEEVLATCEGGAIVVVAATVPVCVRDTHAVYNMGALAPTVARAAEAPAAPSDPTGHEAADVGQQR